jgi:hypothetical protein
MAASELREVELDKRIGIDLIRMLNKKIERKILLSEIHFLKLKSSIFFAMVSKIGMFFFKKGISCVFI